MSGPEPRTSPDYYEKPLTEDSRSARVELEKRLDDLDESIAESKGVALLKLKKARDRVQLALDWQGVNPKELDVDELRDVIQAPLHQDSVDDTYRAKIKNQKTAIRAYCVSCQGGSVVGVKECPSVTCVLFPFRMGKDPLRGYELPKVEEPELTEDDLVEEDMDDGEDEEDDSDED